MFKYLQNVFAPLAEQGRLVIERLPYVVKEADKSSEHMLVRLRANSAGKRPVFFDAHVDTVAPGQDIEPCLQEKKIVSSGNTILAADDKAAVAAMIVTIQKIARENSPHGDLIFVFSSAEEISLAGMNYFDFKKLKGYYGFILDSSGPVGAIITRAPYQANYRINIEGKAAHAGIEPQRGKSAIYAAASLIKRLPQGRVNAFTTANVGKIEGGHADNIVAASCRFSGEFRSLKKKALTTLKKKLKTYVAQVQEKSGCKIDLHIEAAYEGFAYGKQDEIVRMASKAITNCGLAPRLESTGGGSNANDYNAAGLVAVTLSTGMEKIHSTQEYILVQDLLNLQLLIEKLIATA